MSRCYICDYSEETGNKSLYYRGIKTQEGNQRKIILGKKTGNTICTVCSGIINADIYSKELESEKKE